MYGICILNIVPCRKKPSDKSEMVTQLLFGELFKILGKKKSWYKIKCTYDDYQCWIDKKQCHEISLQTYNKLNIATITCASNIIQVISNKSKNITFPITIGSNLPNFEKNKCSIENRKFILESQVNNKIHNSLNDSIVSAARIFINAPYLWGGRSPFGIDCSGFSQLVFKLNGIKLKRDASQQAKQGSLLNGIENAQPGDLAFFENDKGKIVHVGIILKKNQIIHACGKVRIDNYDHYGIFNREIKKHSHKLKFIKRII